MPLRLADECLSLSMAWVITGPDQGGNAGEGRVNSAWCWERKETTCLHLGFGLVDSRTVNKIHFCCVKPPSLWYLATADLAKEYPPTPLPYWCPGQGGRSPLRDCCLIYKMGVMIPSSQMTTSPWLLSEACGFGSERFESAPCRPRRPQFGS